jgi:hypothetical protein
MQANDQRLVENPERELDKKHETVFCFRRYAAL